MFNDETSAPKKLHSNFRPEIIQQNLYLTFSTTTPKVTIENNNNNNKKTTITAKVNLIENKTTFSTTKTVKLLKKQQQ